MGSYQDFLNSNCKILLVTGDRDSITSFIDQYFDIPSRSDITTSQKNKFYIDLKNIANIQQPFLEDYLQSKYEIPFDQINFLKQQEQITFIFYNYGDNQTFVNLYVTQQLSSWQAKSVIVCDKKNLAKFVNYQPCFIPYHHHKKQPELFNELHLPPSHSNEMTTFNSPAKDEKIFQHQTKSNSINIATTLNKYSAKIFIRLEILTSHSLNQILLTHDKNIMQLLADKVNEDHQFKDFLFELTIASKSNPQLSIGAANAITILNYAKISFSNMDLSNINIPSADLQYGVFYNTNFNGANLSAVNFKHTHLVGTDLRNCKMDDVYFGEYAYFEGQNSIYDCCFTSDGLLIAAPIWNLKLVVIIDAINLRVKHNLNGHSDAIESVHFHPNNLMLATGGRDKTVRIWNSQTGQCLFVINDHSDWINCVKYSPNGQHIASCSNDGTIRIYETQDYQCIKILEEHVTCVKAIDFDKTSLRLISIDDHKTIHLWDLITGRTLLAFNNSRSSCCNCIQFSPDNQLIASDNGRHEIEIWRVDSKEMVYVLTGHTETVSSIAFDEEGKYLVSGSHDKSIRVWSLETGNCLRIIDGHTHFVTTVKFSPDYQLIMSASWDNKIRFWPAKTNRNDRLFKGHHKNIKCMTISPNGKYIASGSEDETIRVWLAKTGICQMVLDGYPTGMIDLPNGSQTSYPGSFSCLIFTHDSNFLIAGCLDRSIRIWNINNGVCIHTFKGHTDIINNIHLSPDGKYIASASKDTTIKIWEFDKAAELFTLKGHTQEIHCVKFSPDGKFLASSSGSTRALEELDNVIRIWDLSTQQCIATLTGHKRPVWCVAISPNQQMIASFSDDKTIRVWPFNHLDNNHSQIISVPYPPKKKTHIDESLEQIEREGGPAEPLGIWFPWGGQVLLFSPDNESLIAGDDEIPLHVWSSKNLELKDVIDLGKNNVYAFQTSPKFLIATTTNDDYSIKFWINKSKKLLKQKWYLSWTTRLFLDAKNCLIDHAQGLSLDTYQLLKLRGAIGNIHEEFLVATKKVVHAHKINNAAHGDSEPHIDIANPISFLENKINILTKEQNDENMFNIACLWNDIANTHLTTQQFDLAISCAMEADQLLQTQVAKLGAAHIAKLLPFMIQPEQISESIQSQILSDLKRILLVFKELAHAMTMVGLALKALGQHEDALKQLHQSVAILHTQLQQLPENILYSDAEFHKIHSTFRIDLATSISEIGYILLSQGKSEESIMCLSDAYRMFVDIWIMTYPRCNNARLEKAKEAILTLAHRFYFTNNYDLAKQCYDLLGFKLENVKDHRNFIQKYSEELNYSQLIQQYEILSKIDPKDLSLFISLASVNHSQAIHDKNSNLLETSEKFFHRAIELEAENRIEAKVSYAIFLFQQQRFDAALEQLKKAINCNSDDKHAMNFTKIDRLRLCNELQNELDDLGAITVSSVALCYYFLMLCYLELKHDNSIKEAVVAFSEKVDNLMHYMSCSLLGYTFLRLNHPDVALVCFNYAIERKSDYKLALKNKEKCEHMLKEMTTKDIQNSTIAFQQ